MLPGSRRLAPYTKNGVGIVARVCDDPSIDHHTLQGSASLRTGCTELDDAVNTGCMWTAGLDLLHSPRNRKRSLP
jgi:hypothetical protein